MTVHETTPSMIGGSVSSEGHRWTALAPSLDFLFDRDAGIVDDWIIDAIGTLGDTPPIPPSCFPFHDGRLARPVDHNRCFYRTAPAGGGAQVLCFKGFEVLAADFGDFVKELMLSQKASPGLTLADHFLLIEDKVPGCLTTDEAAIEVDRAVRLHQVLRAEEGPPPRLPIPMAVVRFSDRVGEQVIAVLSKHLSESSLAKARTLVADGLSGYIYAYHCLPVRVEHMRLHWRADARTTSRHPPLLHGRASRGSIDGWLGLAAAMLRQGFLPATAASRWRGACCDPKNAVPGGGFVDMGSVVHVGEIRSDYDIIQALETTVECLSSTILRFLSYGNGPPDGGNAAQRMIARHVHRRLGVLLEAQPQRSAIDPRIAAFFQDMDDLSAVLRLLGQAYV
jgi:hypothetical protein